MGKIKTQNLRSIAFFDQNYAVCEIMWKTFIHPDRSQMAIWRMRIASWITKATSYMHCLSCYKQWRELRRHWNVEVIHAIMQNVVLCLLLLCFCTLCFFICPTHLNFFFAIFITTYFVRILPQITLSTFVFHFTALSGIQTV